MWTPKICTKEEGSKVEIITLPTSDNWEEAHSKVCELFEATPNAVWFVIQRGMSNERK